MAGADLQIEPRGQSARHARPIRQAIETVRLDPRHGVPVGECDLCGGIAELAGAEADAEAVVCCHSGMVRRTRPQMRNCASGNLEIPGSMLRIAPERRESKR